MKAAPCTCEDATSIAVSGWDVKCVCRARKRVRDTKVYSCKPQELYTVKDGKIVALGRAPVPAETPAGEARPQGETFVVTNTSDFLLFKLAPRDRLTTEQIRSLPRFTDYSPGQPSQVRCSYFTRDVDNLRG
ncbi:hypothetical protein PR048_032846 [Dryococelus australis]|uniref:Uncharacterized protein n=1 Tax=Dryococelus australis TaxID=614101 RepID=A0ABQ9G7G9_9NEOP|nr:hypothetical protein PR048_032846 [Dryococelus australis]